MRVRNRRHRHSRFLTIGLVAVFTLSCFFISGVVSKDQKIIGQPEGVAPPRMAVAPPADISVDPAVAAADASIAEPSLPDVAVWENGEIVSLPKDPDARRAALDQLRASTAAKGGPAPEVTYHAVTTAKTQPQFPSPDGANPVGRRYTPTDADYATINLGIPDNFELPADVLRAITESTGQLDPSVEEGLENSLAQSLIQSFPGIDQTNLRPPDPDIAVSRNYVVVVVNPWYAVYDKCGTLLYSQDLGTLTDFNIFLFDPKVRYDEWDDRWLISFPGRDTNTQEARVRLVVSSNEVPPGPGGWYWYNFDWTNNGGWWGDYPDIGFDGNAIYITSNDFNWTTPASFQRARIAVFDKAEVYNAAAAGRSEFLNPLNPSNLSQAFAIRATEMHSLPGEYYLVNSSSFGGNFLSWWEITGAPAAPVLNGWNIPVSTYDDPPPMQQPDGTYIDCGDSRLLTSRYYVSRLWTTHGQRVNWGEATDRSAIEVYIVNSVTRVIAQETGPFGATGLYYSYPAVDFDPFDRGIVCFARGGPTEFGGSRYVDLIEGGAFSGSSLLVAGQANYDDGNNLGTFGDPFRWGDYYGCDLDKDTDNRTLWFYGQFASNSPANTWDTFVGAASFDGPGVLDVTPVGAPTLVSTGFVSGPFFPSGITYTLTNTGGAALTWDLTSLNTWNTPSAITGELGPGSSVNVDVDINGTAGGLAPNTYLDNYFFINCYNGASNLRSTELTVGIDGSCPGSIVDLKPIDGVPNAAPDDNQDRGVFVTALKDFEVCALAIKAEFALPQVITAKIYAANGTTRGALLASGTVTAVEPGEVFHYVPINLVLQECQEYDLAVEWGTAITWPWWNETLITEPYDVGGVIRVRDGEQNGGAGNFAIGNFSLIGTPVVPPPKVALDPGVPPPMFGADAFGGDRGIYVKAEETVHLCSFGWEADLVPPQILTAVVYEASGLVRGAPVAEGTLEVTSGGLKWHDIAINAVLEEGKEYDLSFVYGPQNGWPWWDESLIAEPFTVGAIRVLDANYFGDPSNVALPVTRVSYGPQVAGAAYDIVEPFRGPSPFSSALAGVPYGAYVTALHDQELFSLGWMANIREGEPITARVYEAVGTTRGALISTGTIFSSGDGMRWHDIPVAASLIGGSDYDVEILMPGSGVVEWRYWDDRATPGIPYNAYSLIEVVDSEQAGSPSNFALIHLRMNACDSDPTAIPDDEPVDVPRFALSHPYPNPVSTRATIDYSLDEAGQVTMTVYDVAGRRVATILNGESRPIGRGVAQFDSGKLAAGVYFVKMQTNTKSMTRKITIVR